MLFRLTEVLFRLTEVPFRLTEVLFSLTEVLFSLTEALFRLTEVSFRLIEVLFSLIGGLFRQHGSSGLGRCHSLYEELSDAWCNMSWAVYLVWVDDIYYFPLYLGVKASRTCACAG